MRPLVNGGVRRRQYPADRVAPGTPTTERIKKYVRVDERGCWVWQGSPDRRNGEEPYGQITIGGKVYKAHRVSYEAFVGPIPSGMQIDHLCRVRACVNPSHLEPVSALVNNRRSPLTQGSKTHCPQMHRYTPENTYSTPDGRRHCRTCRRAYLALWHAMTPQQRAERKSAGLPVVDLAAHFAEQEQDAA